MAEPPRRRRGQAAASARILTAGLSSAAAFGMVAGMALAGAADGEEAVTPAVPPRIERRPVATALPQPQQQVIVVVRRHWAAASVAVPAAGLAQQRPSGPIAVPVAGPAPSRATPPTTPTTPPPTPTAAPLAAPKPAARPITRTRSS